jgi:putative polyhydroxyalkanoate system protein
MSEIKITKPHALGLVEARQRANRMVAELAHQYSVAGNWETIPGRDTFMVTAPSGVRGYVAFYEQEILVDIKLDFPVSMFTGQIEATIRTLLDRDFA